MIKCPRCASVVDETKRATCPICFTPLQIQAAPPPAVPETLPIQPAAAPAPPFQAQAPPSAPPQAAQSAPVVPPMPVHLPPVGPTPAPFPSAGRIGPRVALTGEVYEEEPTIAMSAPTFAPPGIAPSGTMPPQGVAAPPVAPFAPVRREMAMPLRREQSTAGGKIGDIVCCILLALIALGGIGSYLSDSNRGAALASSIVPAGVVAGSPEAQAARYFTARKNKDWNTLYEIMDVDKTKYPTAQDYASKMTEDLRQNPQLSEAMDGLMSNVTFKIGQATIQGDMATVPVTMSFGEDRAELNTHETLSLRKMENAWKVTGTSSDSEAPPPPGMNTGDGSPDN